MTKFAIPVLVGLAIVLSIVGLSELIFGNLRETESLKPLWVIIPIMGLVIYFLIKLFNKK